MAPSSRKCGFMATSMICRYTVEKLAAAQSTRGVLMPLAGYGESRLNRLRRHAEAYSRQTAACLPVEQTDGSLSEITANSVTRRPTWQEGFHLHSRLTQRSKRRRKLRHLMIGIEATRLRQQP